MKKVWGGGARAASAEGCMIPRMCGGQSRGRGMPPLPDSSLRAEGRAPTPVRAEVNRACPSTMELCLNAEVACMGLPPRSARRPTPCVLHDCLDRLGSRSEFHAGRVRYRGLVAAAVAGAGV